ncbi:hypothetical protein KIF59_16670 [Enterobacter cloacae subsp. cloacae]|nr:hypothetical protein [Enterobacter cloacae subsp. cloacae]
MSARLALYARGGTQREQRNGVCALCQSVLTTETSLLTASSGGIHVMKRYRSLEEKITRAELLLKYGWDDDVTRQALRRQLEQLESWRTKPA